MSSWTYTCVKIYQIVHYMFSLFCQLYLNKAVLFFLKKKKYPKSNHFSLPPLLPRATTTRMPHSVCPSPAEISPAPESSILPAVDAVVPAQQVHPPPEALLVGRQLTAAPPPEICSWLTGVTLPGGLCLHPRDTNSQGMTDIRVQKSSPPCFKSRWLFSVIYAPKTHHHGSGQS